MINISKCLLQLFSLVASTIWISTTIAQQSIEEVIVTATLKEQSESEIPISLNVLGGDVMIKNNIMTMFDISDRTPGLTISKGTLSNKIYMRGVGSGGNQAFDQSVGQFIAEYIKADHGRFKVHCLIWSELKF